MIRKLRVRLADLRGRGVYSGWPDENCAIFFHLPKTAGTSVSKALGLATSRHLPAEVYRMANPGKFAQYFKFAFVRNPYDRLVSSYAFLRDGGMNNDDARFAKSQMQHFANFEQFVLEGLQSNEICAWVHFQPQADYICDAAGRNLMDFTGRFERLTEDYATIAAQLGCSTALPLTNRSRRGDYRYAYSPAMIDVVRKVYARDLEVFAYSFD